MNHRKFLTRLGLLTAILLVLSYLFSRQFPAFFPWDLLLGSIGLFFLLSLSVFYAGAKSALSKEPNAFTRLIMLFTFGKLFLAGGLVIVWYKFARPDSVYFVIPYFVIYIAYTVFETDVLTRLSKIKAR